VPANNTATGSIAVSELDLSQLRLSIRRVSVNNNHVEVSWPITCAPYLLQTTGDLTPCPEVILCPDIFWTPASVPVQVLQGRYSTVVPADDPQRFFRLRSQ
jgi:hypothetical protein